MISWRKSELVTHCVVNSEKVKMDMAGRQVKELTKWCLDNGQRKLAREEKEEIKLAIDQVDNNILAPMSLKHRHNPRYANIT